jgi:hypothetical protein
MNCRQAAVSLVLTLAIAGAGQPLWSADVEHVIATGLSTWIDLDLKSDNQPGVAYSYFDSFLGQTVTRMQEVGGRLVETSFGENQGGGYFLGPHFVFSPGANVPSFLYPVYSSTISSSRRKLQFEGQLTPGLPGNLMISDQSARDMVFAFGADGHPQVVFDVLDANFDYERWHARWDGSQWVQAQIEAPPLRVQLAKWSMATDPQAGGVYAAYVVRPGGFTTPATRTEFILRRFDASGAPTGRAVLDSGGPDDVPGEVSSMKVDAQGQLHMAYTFEDANRGTWLLKYFAGGIQGGSVETIEQDFWPASYNTGVALALDASGRPYIAYTIMDQLTFEQHLQVIRRDGPGNWVPLAPFTASAGVIDVDLAIGTDDALQVAFMDQSTETVRLVQRPLGGGCQVQVHPVWRQLDLPWGPLPYAAGAKTIAQKGCALTCLAMALNFVQAPADPLWLNSFMNAKNDFNGSQVIWDTTVDDVSLHFFGTMAKLEWQGKRIKSRVDLAAAERELEQTVCNPQQAYPAIVGVKLRPDPTLGNVLVPNHYVLVTGKEGNRFTVIDPLDPSITHLDQYYADGVSGGRPFFGGFETRGHVIDPPGVSRLGVASVTANLLLLDSQGRRTGLALASGEDLQEIPGSVHYLDAIEDAETGELPTETGHTISITEPPEGTYQLAATALRDGPFEITLRALAGDGSAQPPVVLRGEAAAGESLLYRIDVSTSPGVPPVALRCEVSLSPPANVAAATGAGAAACSTVLSEAALGTATATGTCSNVVIDRQGVPVGHAFPVGSTRISYTAKDDLGNTATAQQEVLVTDGTPPAVVAPADVEAPNDPGVAFALVDPGLATASDNCASPTMTGQRDDGLPLTAAYPLGATVITWTARDPAGNATSDQQRVVVRDVERPVLSAVTVDRPVLWPPNHAMIDVAVGYDARDNSGAPTCSLNVTSDEPVAGTGDGDTSPDWAVLDAHRVRLRAERSGHGDGRTYTLTASCIDATGNRASGSVTVSVPKSRSSKK